MKTKNRLLLTSAMMLALVAVSGTTATYAWWVSGLSVNATVSTVTANADASLQVTLANVANTTVTGTEVKANGKLTDVTSADGAVFKKASLDATGSIAALTSVSVAEGVQYAGTVYYGISYSATIKMSEAITGDLKYNVYLGDKEKVLIVESSDSDYAARMAVSNGTSTFIVGNSAGKYQSALPTGTPGNEGYSDGTATVSNYTNLANTTIEEVTKATAVGTYGTNFCLGTLASATQPLTITFTMWFEGAVTKDNVVAADTFSANLYFYAIRVA